MENRQSQVILCGSGWEAGESQGLSFNRFHRVLEAYKPEDVIPVLQQVSEETGKGFTAVGFAAYEAAAAFGLPVHGSKKSAIPLCWFGIVSAETREQWNVSSGNISPASDYQTSSIANLKLNQTESQYYETLASLKSFIERGDSYQVNYTLRASFQSDDDEIGLFQSLYHNQAVPYAALIQTPEWQFIFVLVRVRIATLKVKSPEGRTMPTAPQYTPRGVVSCWRIISMVRCLGAPVMEAAGKAA